MTLQQLVLLALQVSIILTVFGFGLRTTFADMLYLTRRPMLLARSFLAMFVVMPVIAVVMARMFELRPSVEIVLVALAISPLPPLLPGKQGRAGGHAAYALGLMALASLLAIVIVPLGAQVIGQIVGRPFVMSSAAIARTVVTMTLLPLAAGLIVRALAPAVAERLAKPVGLVATSLLMAGVLALLVAVLPATLPLIGNGTLLAMGGFVIAGLAIGHWLGGPNPEERVVLALSTASRHPAIALAVAKANFPDEPGLGATVVLFLLVNAVIGLAYISRRRRAVS